MLSVWHSILPLSVSSSSQFFYICETVWLFLPRGWCDLWWAGNPEQGRTAQRGRYRSSCPSRSGHKWQNAGWEEVRVSRWGLWPGKDTADASAGEFGCWWLSAAAGPRLRKDPGTPTLEGCGRSPVSQRELANRSAVCSWLLAQLSESDQEKIGFGASCLVRNSGLLFDTAVLVSPLQQSRIFQTNWPHLPVTM